MNTVFYQRTALSDGHVARWLSLLFGCWIMTTIAPGQEPAHPSQAARPVESARRVEDIPRLR